MNENATDTGVKEVKDTGVMGEKDTGVMGEKDTGVMGEKDTGATDTGVMLEKDTGVMLEKDTGVMLEKDTGVMLEKDTGATGVKEVKDTGATGVKDTGVKEVKDTGVKVPHELVGKGGYGCVYKPNISCSGSLNPEGNYISKIQMSNEVSKNINKETQYGKIVQSFPDYRLYFAPVIESCPININVLSEEELSKCDIFQQPTAEMMGTMDAKVGETNAKVGATYVSSKIPFIEGKNMSVYFKAREQFESPFFPSNVSRSFYHLLKAIRILQSGTDDSIVHFDLKDGNIIFDEIHGNPVIIDFGLSFTKSTLMDNLNDTQKLAEVFYAYSPYEPWCIEIHLLSYIVQNILLKLDEEGNRGEKITAPITEEEIKELKDVCQKFVDDLAKKNVGGNNDYIPDIQQLNSYLDSFIVGKDIWKELVEDLAKHYLSWDVYSIAICYLKYINDWNIGLLDGILRDVVAFVPVKGSEGRRRKSVDEIIGLL